MRSLHDARACSEKGSTSVPVCSIERGSGGWWTSSVLRVFPPHVRADDTEYSVSLGGLPRCRHGMGGWMSRAKPCLCRDSLHLNDFTFRHLSCQIPMNITRGQHHSVRRVWDTTMLYYTPYIGWGRRENGDAGAGDSTKHHSPSCLLGQRWERMRASSTESCLGRSSWLCRCERVSVKSVLQQSACVCNTSSAVRPPG